MRLILHPFELRLKHPFKIAHSERTSQKTLIVELKSGDISGYGEAAANTYFGIVLEEMCSLFATHKNKIEKASINNPELFWKEMFPYFCEATFPQCALDIAAHDLYGKMAKKPLYKLWGLKKQSKPISNYTIGIDSLENMIAKVKETPWPIYKIKLGTAEDLEIVKALRAHTEALFRVDANCAWNVEQTIAFSKILKKLNVEFIEQPLPANDWEGMREVKKYSALPLIADESCLTEADVHKCKGLFDGINIKLTKCGGITPALRMIQNARTMSLKVMMGCMTESTVGISAIAHFLPLLDFVDMDGALLIRNDIATGVRVSSDGLYYAGENGTGAQLLGNQ